MTLSDKPSKDEYFVYALGVALFIGLILACTPDSCPAPLYSAGDTVLVDDVFTGTVLDSRVLGCGDIVYDVMLEVNGKQYSVAEGRITPFE